MKRIKQTVCLLLSVMLISISSVSGFAAETSKIYGNIDGDNAISVKDATLICKSLVQVTTIDDEYKALADVDGNNAISVADATCIQKYLVGLSGSGRTGEPYLTEEEKIDALRQEVLDLVNVERAAEGLEPLELDADISACADVRAQEIVDVFAHTRPDGTPWYTIFDEMNVPVSRAGENIAAGYPTPSEVMDGWMNSEGHRANILKPEFSQLGVGIYVDNGRYYWVQLFSGSEKPVEPSVPEEVNIEELKQEVLNLVNVERAAEGLNSLELDADISACADVRAKEIVGVFDHKRPDGTAWSTIFEEMNVPIVKTAGENIAAGYPTPAAVMNGWMNSEGHKANILRHGFNRLGVGIYVDNGRYYWVQLFMG